jgi:hypothetical protein
LLLVVAFREGVDEGFAHNKSERVALLPFGWIGFREFPKPLGEILLEITLELIRHGDIDRLDDVGRLCREAEDVDVGEVEDGEGRGIEP